MKKIVIAFVSGFFCCGLLMAPILYYLNDKIGFYKKSAYCQGALDIAIFLSKYFDKKQDGVTIDSMAVKDCSIMVKKRQNGDLVLEVR